MRRIEQAGVFAGSVGLLRAALSVYFAGHMKRRKLFIFRFPSRRDTHADMMVLSSTTITIYIVVTSLLHIPETIKQASVKGLHRHATKNIKMPQTRPPRRT